MRNPADATDTGDFVTDHFEPLPCLDEATTTYETKNSRYDNLNGVRHYCAIHAVDAAESDELDRIINSGEFLDD